MGFLEVDKLIKLCRSTKWTTYKIWQAVKAGDLEYKPVTYVRKETTLRDALKVMLVQGSKFAVVKKGQREIGMVGETRLKEQLNMGGYIQEESKDDSYIGQIHRKLKRWRESGSFNDNSRESGRNTSSFMNHNNRISKDGFGNELSRISRGVEADMSSLDSQDRNDIESCRLTV